MLMPSKSSVYKVHLAFDCLRNVHILMLLFFLSFTLLTEELMDEYAYNDQPLEDLPMQYQTLPFLSKLASEVALRPRVRREWIARRGVYDECCRNPCSFNTLKSYCKRKN